MFPDINAVIFDFDGVLVNSEPLHEWAIRESVRPLGWDFSTENFYAHIVGRGDENAYRRIAEWNGARVDESQLKDLLKIKWALMADGIAAGKYEVQPGALEAMQAAKSKYPIAVCSGSVRATVDALLRKLGMRELLTALVCGDDVPNMKPAPDGYLLAAKLLGASPARCMAIEDTPTGVKAARNAGIRVVGVCHTVDAGKLHEADLVLGRIDELKF